MTMMEKALSLVGQGYIYGAKGQTCTPDFRKQQAQQYPEQADHILHTGQKWDGLPVWDCAQLTRAVAREAGVSLPSGATSQWQKTAWTRKGEMDSIPQNEAVFVYREGDGRMQHTGVSLGDGTCVHAKGTAYGVVREPLSEPGWTHWAVVSFTPCRVWAPSGSTVNARQTAGGKVIFRVPIGETVEVSGTSGGWSRILYNGKDGYMQSAFLTQEDAALTAIQQRLDDIERRLKAAGL